MIPIKPFSEDYIKSTNIKNKDEEYFLIQNILSQIRTWFSQNSYPINEVNTLLLNKLLYFTIKKLQKINLNIKFSGGWYRYGPCLEEYRDRGEEGTTDLTVIKPFKTGKILPQVLEICEKEVPLFIKFSAQTKLKRYPYEYLKHVYSDHVEYPELRDYYLSKNELAYSYLQFAFNKAKSPTLREKFINFEKAIISNKYSGFVQLNDKMKNATFDYLSLMRRVVTSASYDELKKQPLFWAALQKIATDFEKNILGFFSYKNYLATYSDVDKRTEKRNKDYFKKRAEDYGAFVATAVESSIGWVDTILGE